MLHRTLLLVAAVLAALGATAASGEEANHALATQLRRPVAMALSADGETLYVANQASGTISQIDARRGKVVREIPVAKRLADVHIADDTWLLAVDESRHQLVILKRGDSRAKVYSRLDVPHSPVSVEPLGERRCAVACLWARQVALVDWSEAKHPGVEKRIDLPFAPRAQLATGDGKLYVADAFGGGLAVLDPSDGQRLSLQPSDGHNIRRLVLAPGKQELWIPQQVLSSEYPTTKGGVHWGNVMSNIVRRVPLSEFAKREIEPAASENAYYLGYPDRATGDPSDMLLTSGGRQIIALSGVSEVAVSDRNQEHHQRIATGRGPSALALSPDERFCYVANRFSDSVSVIDVEVAKVVREISLGPQPELGLAERGEMLFHDASLSSDGWYSCHSCHTDGHSNGRLNDNFGDQSYGAPKRVISLLGVNDTSPWAWDGKVRRLEEQIHKSVTVTMQGQALKPQQAAAIAAYLRTLRAPPGVQAARGEHQSAAVKRGREVFGSQGCRDCHAPPAYTSAAVYDVGLHDEKGTTEFNPPSLRGVSQRGPYFHDNRAATLEQVFRKHQHGLEGKLSPAQLADLIAFLRSL